VFGPTKTAAGSRLIFLPDSAVAALRAHIERFELSPDGLVFTTRRGSPMTRARLGEAWRRAAEGLDLPPAARGWHSLRHTYASSAIAGGVDVVSVAAAIGHSDPSMTLSVYSHHDAATVRAARNVAAELLLPRADAQ
jgi:integrase